RHPSSVQFVRPDWGRRGMRGDATPTRRMERFVTPQVPLSQDAALVVALAGTAMPFAHSREDEAERWLRTLRLHGTVGATLQALGVGEASLLDGPGADV